MIPKPQRHSYGEQRKIKRATVSRFSQRQMNLNRVNEDNCRTTNMLVQANCIVNYVRHISILQCTKPQPKETEGPKNKNKPHTQKQAKPSNVLPIDCSCCSTEMFENCCPTLHICLVFIVKWIIRMGGRVDCPVQSNKMI